MASYLDSRLKKQLNERISRGKVELSMTVQNVDAADTVVAVNMELARSYQQAMRDISEQLGVKNDISAGVLTRFPDVLTTRHADVDEEQLVLTVLDPSWQGKRFYAKVKALGSVYDSTEDSEFGDSETFRWE